MFGVEKDERNKEENGRERECKFLSSFSTPNTTLKWILNKLIAGLNNFFFLLAVPHLELAC